MVHTTSAVPTALRDDVRRTHPHTSVRVHTRRTLALLPLLSAAISATELR